MENLLEICKMVFDSYLSFWVYSRNYRSVHTLIKSYTLTQKVGVLYLLKMRELIRHIIREHIMEQNKPRGYWTLEKVLELASKYETIKDFRVNHNDAYRSATHHGWLDELRKVLKSSKGEWWTLDKVKERASKYNTLQDFYTNDYNAYYAAIRNKWIEEINSNLERLGNLYKRAVYALEFPDKSVYVGLTLNLNNRERQHIGHEKETPVSKHIKKTGLKPIFKIISDDYIDAEDARNLEDCTIGQYKSEGWNMLNTAKAGALGACDIIYTLEKVKEVASQFTNIGEFKKNARPYYRAALRNGWFDEITVSMDRKIGKRITKDQVRDVVQKYTTLADFEREQPSYYAAAKRNQWDDITSHLQRKQKKRGDIIFIQDQPKP
jgi:hypothetical protein